jgi:hypothetical protein
MQVRARLTLEQKMLQIEQKMLQIEQKMLQIEQKMVQIASFYKSNREIVVHEQEISTYILSAATGGTCFPAASVSALQSA